MNSILTYWRWQKRTSWKTNPSAIKCDIAPSGYSIYRANKQSNGKGGGNSLIVRESLQSQPLKLSKNFSSFEICAVQFNVRSGWLNLFAIYRPPHSPGFLDDFSDFLNEVVALLGIIYNFGDMNCPSEIPGHADHHMEEVIDEFYLVQHIHVVLMYMCGGLLDLVITTPKNPEVTSMHVEEMGFTYHIVIVTILGCTKPRPVWIKKFQGCRHQYLPVEATRVQRKQSIEVSANELATQLRNWDYGDPQWAGT